MNTNKWNAVMLKNAQTIARQGGFTLIEIIVGIVTLGIVLSLLTVLLFPQAKRSAEPLLQMRAAELGIALMNEISSKSFDHNSDHAGGAIRCGEIGAPSCTNMLSGTGVLGPDGEARDEFNDVDDYHGLNNMTDSLGGDLSARYPGFSYSIHVCYSTASGTCVTPVPIPPSFKRVQITVTTPMGQNFLFSSIRGNY
ncbi:prepilin-type N-terminal cleavage/methylation domain-containing protein [Aliidiomarina quisquiliarum]|uniref:prepilin-type N-terminal cleavage/methylation domain-containing protein n=1 Tax=Aliidiomarina quisquiliarum TaxID=2938947 RepID=UPI00208EF3CE|nr:type II secretion system protein [Aliidiomarina quisquiliarum]MCO4322493.1 type II secretion system GspH family protein [Aliidiomarina quisquiliarum]